MREAFKAIYIKSNPCGSQPCGHGIITNITYFNFVIEGTVWYPIWIGPQQQHQPATSGNQCSFIYPIKPVCVTEPTVFMDFFTLRNIDINNGDSIAGVLLCDPTLPCKNVVFDNVQNRGAFSAFPEFTCINARVKFLEGTSPVFPCNGTGVASP